MATRSTLACLFLVFGLCISFGECKGVDNEEYFERDWQVTPAGYAHKSCIHRNIPQGSSIKRASNGDVYVHHPDGSVRRGPKCDYQMRFPNASGDFAPGWQIWTTYEGSESFTSFLGTFSVPDTPVNYESQTLFMFTGLQNDDWIPGPNAPPAPADFEIIQPVLQYGPSAGGGGEYWSLASWYVTVDAGYYVSEFIQINSGDSIFGNMTQIGEDTWYINSVIQSSGAFTNLTVTSERLGSNPWAYCTLEVYDVESGCTDFPTVAQVYQNLAIYVGKQKQTPKWQVNANPDVLCGQHATVESPSHVTLHFGSN